MTKKIQEIVSICELTVRLEKRRVARNSLIQQAGCLDQISVSGGAKDRRQKKAPCLRIEIEGFEIGSWLARNGHFLSG